MVEDNETIMLSILAEHEPRIVVDWACCTVECSARDCNYAGEYGWADHVKKKINDAIGWWGPEDECPHCGWDETSSDVHAEDCGR